MGEKNGAFTTVVSRDPEVFRRENLRQFDAVCLNNTVGNLFTDPELRQNLLEFVLAGGGLLGIHGTTVAFTDFPNGAKETWPEFARMIGGRGAAASCPGRARRGQARLAGASAQPALRPRRLRAHQRVLPRPRSLFARSRSRALQHRHGQDEAARQGHATPAWSATTTTTPWRGPGTTAAAGSSIARSATARRTSWTPRSSQFYLGAIQFVMGDLDGTTTPTARLTPAVVAREKLGWRFGRHRLGAAHVHAVRDDRQDPRAWAFVHRRTEFPEGEQGYRQELRRRPDATTSCVRSG